MRHQYLARIRADTKKLVKVLREDSDVPDPMLSLMLTLRVIIAFAFFGIVITMLGNCSFNAKELDAPRKGVSVEIEH